MMEAWFFLLIALASGFVGWAMRGLARDAKYADLWGEYVLLAQRYTELYRAVFEDQRVGFVDPHEGVKRLWAAEETELLDKFSESKFGRKREQKG